MWNAEVSPEKFSKLMGFLGLNFWCTYYESHSVDSYNKRQLFQSEEAEYYKEIVMNEMVSPKMNSESLQEEPGEISKMAHVKGETPTPERPPSSASPGSASSEDTCSICLGHITDKCVTDSCLHSFCLLCLKEWAKQKAVCPLCKLSFTKIMYEIKSETEYKEWKVPPPEPPERSLGATYFQEFLDAERRRFFGYRTTPFPGASRLRSRNDLRRSAMVPDAIPSFPPHRRARYSLRGSTMFRLSVYLNNIWVQPLADITGRYRQTSPELYREQPALTHRLVPWVNRELAALVPSSRVGTVLTEVMDLIERHPINSREFQNAMQPHLGERTRHFIHEFYHFARSPYDMVGHDNAAQYVPRYGNEFVSDTSNSDDSDAVVEVDAIGNPVASTSSVDGSRGQTAPGNVVREEILTHGGSVVISSSESSDTEISQAQHASVDESNFELTHNPECPPGMRRLIGRAVDFLASVNDGASTSRSEGHESTAPRALSQNEEVASENDSDGCMIIDEVVPRVPTPEIIELDSDNELSPSGIPDDSVTNDLHRIRMRRKLRGKSKPSLKRTNFVELPSSQNDASAAECNVAQQDHSYCTEDGSANTLPSSSRRNTQTRITKNSPATQQGKLSSESDENETEEYRQYAASGAMSSSHPSTRRGKCELRKSYDRKRRNGDCSHNELSDKPRKRRCSAENKVSGMKDLKSKIKSSASRRNSGGQPEGADGSHSSYQIQVSIHSDDSSENSHSAWSQMVARNAKSNKVQHSSDSTWVPLSDRYDRTSGSTSRYGQQDFSSSSEESCSESKSSRYSDKYRMSKKTSRKRKRKSKEKHKEKSKRSSKRKKHRRKSKSKKYSVSANSDSESSKHKKLKKSGYKLKHLARDSDSESASSYLKYKRKTTVSVRRYRGRISSSSSDTYP